MAGTRFPRDPSLGLASRSVPVPSRSTSAPPAENALPGWVVVVTIVAVLRGLAAVILPVLPEEAYHWCYARHPALGYYDHPPCIAWMIGAGRLLLGDTALGIRLFPWLASIGTC